METDKEIRTEASIYALGTAYTTDELVREYNEYRAIIREHGMEPLDFQRWAEAAGYGD